MRPYLIIAYLVVTVAMGATSDALNNSGAQDWGHNFNMLEIAMLISAVFLFKTFTWKEFLFLFGAYICYRIAGFDYIYNWVRGNSWDYLGGNNWWDQWWTEIVRIPPHGLVFVRGVFLIVGLSFPFKYIR